MKSKIQFCFLVLFTILIYTTSIQAISISLKDPNTQADSGWAMVVRSDLIEGGQVKVPYVYGVTNDAVTIQIDKIFNRPFDQDGFNYPIIIEFEKTSSNASTNIVIRDEYVGNETGSEWVDYHMHLIVDALNPEAGFDPGYIPDGDQLEEVFFTWNIGYNDLPIQLHFRDTNGDGVLSSPPAERGENAFQPGYYGGQIVIIPDPQMQVGEHFGLKEIPTIPEPATLFLLGVGGLVSVIRKGKYA